MKSSEKIKQKNICIKCTDKEKREYQKSADKKGLKMSEYIREVLNDNTKKNRRRIKKIPRYLVQNQENLNDMKRYIEALHLEENEKEELKERFDRIVEGELKLWGC